MGLLDCAEAEQVRPREREKGTSMREGAADGPW